jgi:CheY-like chemotaxis protein
VRDTGVGVAPAKRQAIFDEFVQADSSHARRFGGTGLGLAISKRLVESMGGKIGVDARPGGGSCFWFLLPLIATAAAEAPVPLRDVRVAVASRNPLLREGLHLQIAASGGVPVEASENADIVLVDAGTGNRPELAMEPAQGAAFLVLLTPNARGALPEMRAKGFAGYLVKPVRQSSLVTQLLQCRGGARLPDAAPPAAQSDADSVPAREAQGGLHILLAEDNPINMLLIRELLRRRGHRITEVTSGTAAVKALAENSFDILLTDIHMPGMDGIEAARAIREAEAEQGRPRTPIVALTADVLEDGKQSCQEAGMDGFLAKPVNPAELDEMLRSLFPGTEPSHIVAA